LENIEKYFLGPFQTPVPGSTGSIVLSNPNCLVIILKSEYPLNFFMEQTVTIIA